MKLNYLNSDIAVLRLFICIFNQKRLKFVVSFFLAAGVARTALEKTSVWSGPSWQMNWQSSFLRVAWVPLGSLWYPTLVPYFGTLFWYPTLVAYFGTLFWYSILVPYFGTLLW